MTQDFRQVDWPDAHFGRRKSILEKAEVLDLPVTKKNVKIARTSNRIKVTVTYVMEIEFPGYTYVWHKEHFHDRPLFYN